MGNICSCLHGNQLDSIPQYINDRTGIPADGKSLLSGENLVQEAIITANQPTLLLKDIDFAAINDDELDEDSIDSVQDAEIEALLKADEDADGNYEGEEEEEK